MKLNIKYDINICCKTILQEQLDKLELAYIINGLGEIELKQTIGDEKYKTLEAALNKYGIEIIKNPKQVLTQKIKNAIVEMVFLKETLHTKKNSAFLADRLNKSYNYLADVFSEVTLTSIQSYIILQRIERTKQEIIEGELTLTEIAWKLKYSSAAHLSNEFKKITGLSPTSFQQILESRKKTDFTSQE